MSSPRGARSVGLVADLDDVEACAIRCLRLWCDGPDMQAVVWNDFATALGPGRGRAALRAFETLCDLCQRHGRRPLMRRPVPCDRLSADEACFATFIGYAGDASCEDAMLIAATMVRPDMAPIVVGLARDVALALRRMARCTRRPAMAAPAPTLH